MKLHTFSILTILLCIGSLLSAQEWTEPEYWANLSPEDLQIDLRAGTIDVTEQDKDGRTPLMLAAEYTNTLEIITTLLNAGADANADINAQDENGWTALMLAVIRYSGNPEIITALLNAEADIHMLTANGEPILMFAIKYSGNPEIIATIINAGADVNAQDQYGNTPLMEAAWHNDDPEIITALLNAGADVNMVETLFGKTAWDFAQENEALEGTDVYWELVPTEH